MSIEDVLKHLRKEVADALEYDTKLEGITTGCIAVDRITGIGGWPIGRVSEAFGWEGCGKTTLLLSSCAQAQRKGKYPAYLDIERGVDLIHAERIGFNWRDETKGLYATPSTSEEVFKIVEALVDSGACDIICVDSVPSMVPEKIAKGDIDDLGGIGLASRILSAFLSRITKSIAKNRVALVFANQMRAKINTSWASRNEPNEQAAGGSAIKFYSSLRIELSKHAVIKDKRMDPDNIKEVDVAIGYVHRAKAFKNKVAVPNRECEFTIKFDPLNMIYGIDNMQTVIDIAKGKGIISAGGAGFYQYPAEGEPKVKCRGASEFRNLIMANDAIIYKEIRQKAGV